MIRFRDIAVAVAFVLGLLFLLIGVTVTLTNWSISPVDPNGADLSVYRMNDRLVGVIVGVGWTIASLLFLGFVVRILRTK